MWAKLVDIIETKLIDADPPPYRSAKAVNAVYGAIMNCQIAFRRFEATQTDTEFANFAFAVDALLSTLHNLAAQLDIFDAERAQQLTGYVLGEQRMADRAKPRELVKSHIKLLRELVRLEADSLEMPVAEIGSFTDALERLGLLIRQRFTLEDLFGPETH